MRRLRRLACQVALGLLTLLLAACAGNDAPEPDAPRSAQRDADRSSERGERHSDRNVASKGFDRAVARLEIKRPPLRAQQVIQFGRSHRLYVAVRGRYFLCTLSVPERRRAVGDFYARSRQEFEDAGVEDFRVVVTRLQSGGVDYPRWARAGPRGVRLTRAGRRSAC